MMTSRYSSKARYIVGLAIAVGASGCSQIDDLKLKREVGESLRARFHNATNADVRNLHVVRSSPTAPGVTVCGTVELTDSFGRKTGPVRFVQIKGGEATLETDFGGLGSNNVDYLCTGTTTDEGTGRAAAAAEAMIADAQNSAP
ncbi:hypothetical protein [Brevundimonas sp.]|uniref:hypothetical protein n=1 Tax=Brevundimonas sp. TaxID=1871086 RepID=UPI00356A55F0